MPNFKPIGAAPTSPDFAAQLPALWLGELIHATDIAHMACCALVSGSIVSCEVFTSYAAQIEQGWQALEANSEDNDRAAIAWARRRMKDFIEDMKIAHVTSANRLNALASMMPVPDSGRGRPTATE